MKRKASAGNNMEIILASGSSRRKEILSDLGYTFTVQPANGEEVLELENGIDQAIELIAYRKAKEVQKLYPNACVIGADTVVCFQNEILGKPKTKEEAVDTLVDLSGQAHEVKTGVCICLPHEDLSFTETTHVQFRELSAQDIMEYVNKGTCLDKAGSYGIQECDFVEKIDGSYSNVVGLPKGKVNDILRIVLKS